MDCKKKPCDDRDDCDIVLIGIPAPITSLDGISIDGAQLDNVVINNGTINGGSIVGSTIE